jgi:hypothetical protein
MEFIKTVTSIAALAAIATVASAGSAEAISFKITKGIANPTTGATNQGAYSDFAGTNGVTTIDFNAGFNKAATSVDVNGKDGSKFMTYSFNRGMAVTSGSTGVYADKWAPSGPNGEVNDSKYLAVFKDNIVTMTFTRTMNYFGINWGAISSGNTFSFFRNGQMVKSFNTGDVNPVAPTIAAQHDGEGNGYLHFYSDSNNDNFDEIRISQVGGGGFESDNHSFHEGSGRFDYDKELKDVPEPTVTLGLMAMGGAFLLSKRNRKQLA